MKFRNIKKILTVGVAISIMSSFTVNAAPFFGDPIKIGQGVTYVEAEDFDTDDNHSSSSDDEFAYRSDGMRTGVAERDGVEGYNVGWLNAGDWFQHTLEVETSGTYLIEARVCTGWGGGASFDLSWNGESLATVNVPEAGWNEYDYQTVGTFFLEAGTHILKTDINAGVNMDAFRFTLTEEASLEETPEEASEEEISEETSEETSEEVVIEVTEADDSSSDDAPKAVPATGDSASIIIPVASLVLSGATIAVLKKRQKTTN